MIWELEYFLVLLFSTVPKILTKFFYAICHICKTPPPWMHIQPQFTKVFAYIDMLVHQLSKVHWIPVSNLKQMSSFSYTKSGAVFIKGYWFSIFCETKLMRHRRAILTLFWQTIFWLNNPDMMCV